MLCVLTKILSHANTEERKKEKRKKEKKNNKKMNGFKFRTIIGRFQMTSQQ